MKLQTKKWIIGLAATGCAVTMGITGCVIGLRDNSSTITNNDTTSYVKVDELWNGTEFNRKSLTQLLQYVSGNSAASVSNLAPVKSTTKTATDMRGNAVGEKTSGKDIIVTFGGLDWEVVYLSPDNTTNADPVLTLWLSNNTQSAWSSRSSTEGELYGYLNGGLYSDWAGDWYSKSQILTYPSSMYGTSYIRTVTLNNGGLYTQGNDETTSPSTATATQNASSAFAKFTMPSVEGSVTQFLNKPNTMSWQLNQTKNTSISSYSLPNDSINAPTDAKWYSNMNFTDRTGYSDWGNDYLWLPSITETGRADSNTGMWKTSIAQRQNYDGSTTSSVGAVGSNNQSSGTSAYAYSWLRSGFTANSYGAYYLYPSGANSFGGTGNLSRAVRPALHLNLSKAAEAAGPETWYDHADTSWEDETAGNTEATAYEIDTPEKLAGVAYMVGSGTNYSGKYFKQTANIDLGGYDWTPIGDDGVLFKGNFNGNGYTIKNMYVNKNGRAGLFGEVNTAVLRNITLKESTVMSSGQCTGSIAGLLDNASIMENCTSSATVISTADYVGGLVGYYYSSTIRDSSFSGYVQGTTQVGGIVGELHDGQDKIVERCINTGMVRGKGDVGGIVGRCDYTNNQKTIKNCISYGSVYFSDKSAGSIVGAVVGDTLVENCAGYGQIIAEESSCAFYAGLVGYCEPGIVFTIRNSCFVGGCNQFSISFVSGYATADYTIDSCFMQANQKGYYSSGDFSGWVLCGDMNEGLPIQKTLYAVAQFGDSVDAEWFANKGFEKV